MDPITFAIGLSLHLGFENEYNSIHPHIRYQQNTIIAGAFYNSEENISTYIGQRVEHNDLGFEYGVATGYYDSVTPYVRVTYKDFFVAPGVENNETIGLVAGYEIKY